MTAFTSVVAYTVLTVLVTGAQPPEHVKRAVFTHGISDREPVNAIDSLPTDSTRVYFFTEIVDLAGSSVTHRWNLDGETMAEVPFEIGGPRWRVYSSKKLIPEWAGVWTVEIVDAQGTVLGEERLVYYVPE
jgi:hypothetical protein